MISRVSLRLGGTLQVSKKQPVDYAPHFTPFFCTSGGENSVPCSSSSITKFQFPYLKAFIAMSTLSIRGVS
jgi:hypothetical protein